MLKAPVVSWLGQKYSQYSYFQDKCGCTREWEDRFKGCPCGGDHSWPSLADYSHTISGAQNYDTFTNLNNCALSEESLASCIEIFSDQFVDENCSPWGGYTPRKNLPFWKRIANKVIPRRQNTFYGKSISDLGASLRRSIDLELTSYNGH